MRLRGKGRAPILLYRIDTTADFRIRRTLPLFFWRRCEWCDFDVWLSLCWFVVTKPFTGKRGVGRWLCMQCASTRDIARFIWQTSEKPYEDIGREPHPAIARMEKQFAQREAEIHAVYGAAFNHAHRLLTDFNVPDDSGWQLEPRIRWLAASLIFGQKPPGEKSE